MTITNTQGILALICMFFMQVTPESKMAWVGCAGLIIIFIWIVIERTNGN